MIPRDEKGPRPAMNFKSWNIGRVGGIDVAIHPTFWLVPA